MMHSETIASLAAALVKAQGEMPSVTKDRDNPHFKFRYATLDAILDTVKPVLAKHGLAIFQSGGESTPASVTVETMVLHASGEWIMSSVTIPLAKQDAQGVGSGMTYGRRYGLSAALSLATDDDDDANAASKPHKAATPATDRARARVATPAVEDAAQGSERVVRGKKLADYGKDELNEMAKALRAEGSPKHKWLLADIASTLNDRLLGPSKKNAPPLSDEQRGELVKAADVATGKPTPELPFP